MTIYWTGLAALLLYNTLSMTMTMISSVDFQVGPLRCWPGGLCLSRSIGDTDVGEFIVPVPHVKQVKVSYWWFFISC